MTESKPTVSGAVPTIWNDLLGYLDEHPTRRPTSLAADLSAAPPCRPALKRPSRSATAWIIRRPGG